MKDETALYVVKKLQENFSRKFGGDSLAAIKPSLLQEPDSAMMAAGDRIILEHSSLPSAAKLLQIVQQEGKRIRLEEAKQRDEAWKREKGEDDRGRVDGPTGLTKAQASEYGKRAMMLVQLVMEHGATQDAIDGCLVMANTYPAFAQEWRETRQELIRSRNEKQAQDGPNLAAA